MRRVFVLLFSFILLNFCVAHAATSTQPERDSLKGLKKAWVLLGIGDEDAAAFGLDRSMLRTQVELRLRQAGLVVVPADPSESKHLADGCFVIEFNFHKITDDAQAVSVDAYLSQLVIVKRNKRVVPGRTWNRNLSGWFGTKQGKNLQERINDITDLFLNDWLAANPRK